MFVADLTVELRAWPQDTWTAVGVDPDQVAQAVIGCWQDGEVSGLQIDDLGMEEARSLTHPAMTYIRAQLRGRLTARLTLVARFAELHGGRAWVQDRPGGGASFRVLLPDPPVSAAGSAAPAMRY